MRFTNADSDTCYSVLGSRLEEKYFLLGPAKIFSQIFGKPGIYNLSLKRLLDNYITIKAPPPLAIIMGTYYVAITPYFFIIMESILCRHYGQWRTGLTYNFD